MKQWAKHFFWFGETFIFMSLGMQSNRANWYLHHVSLKLPKISPSWPRHAQLSFPPRQHSSLLWQSPLSSSDSPEQLLLLQPGSFWRKDDGQRPQLRQSSASVLWNPSPAPRWASQHLLLLSKHGADSLPLPQSSCPPACAMYPECISSCNVARVAEMQPECSLNNGWM